jgi:hypothetical protein
VSVPGEGAQPVSASPSEAGVDRGGGLPDPPAADWSQPNHLSDQSLSMIHERMDQLSQQTSQIAEALGQRYADNYDEHGYANGDGYEDDGYEDDDGEEIELSPEDYARLEAEFGPDVAQIAAEVEGEADGEGDLIDRLAGELEGRLGRQQDAERALEDREDAFEELREALPVLQDEQTAMRVVQAAADFAERWNPNLVNGPEFVQLVEMIALAGIAEQAAARERSAPEAKVVQLEGASGARPAQPAEPDWGQRMLDAAERIRPMI